MHDCGFKVSVARSLELAGFSFRIESLKIPGIPKGPAEPAC